jgi:hypothetical protein
MVTRVVHLQRDPYDARIDRASRFGNPFGLAGTKADVVVATAAEAVEAHARWLAGDPRYADVRPGRRQWVLANVGYLRDKTLGCWCAPRGGATAADRPHVCHGQTLAGLADTLADTNEEGRWLMTEAMTTTTTEPVTDLAALPTADLEAIVTRKLRDLVEVGTALKLLQERRAYLDRGYGSFGDYCRALWGFGRQYGYRLIAAVETTAALTVAIGDTDAPPPPPANEAQARELAPLRKYPEALAEVWHRAVETAPGGEAGKVTARHIRLLVAEALEHREQMAQARREEAARDEAQRRRTEARQAARQTRLAAENAGAQERERPRRAEREALEQAHGGEAALVTVEGRVSVEPTTPPTPPAEVTFTVEEWRFPDGTPEHGGWETDTPVGRCQAAAWHLLERIGEARERLDQLSDELSDELTEREAGRQVAHLAPAEACLREAVELWAGEPRDDEEDEA